MWITVAVRRHRRVGVWAAGVLAATLTLTTVIGVSPVGAQEASPEDIADRLVQSVAGYVALPEGDSGGMTSGPTTPDELAGIVGADISDPAVGSAAGYMRVFATPAGDGTAIAVGIDTGGVRKAADFLTGIQHGAAAQASAMPLFPGEQPPLGKMVAYEVTDPGSSRRVVVTAIASNSIGVVLAVGDPNDNVAVLRQMVRDQAALTPPTRVVGDVASASPDSPRPDGEEKTLAYKVGRVAALLILVGIAVWGVRAVRRGLPGSPSSSSWPSSPPPPPPPPPRP
jgi:hypothetical protein